MDVEHEGGSTVATASLSSPSDSKRAAPLTLTTRSQSSSRRASVELSLSHGVSLSELGSPPASPADAGLSSQASTATRSYDVYIGASGKDPSLIRYAKWMHAELEIDHSLTCFTADSNNCDVARTVLHSAAHGVVLITRQSFRNPYTIEELTVFLSRGNLVPVFFDVAPADCLEKPGDGSPDGELWKVWSDAMEGLLAVEAPRRVEAYQQNWRESIRQIAASVGSNKEVDVATDAELPWMRNGSLAGREKELKAMENILFPDTVVGNAASLETVAQTLARRSADASSSKAETDPESEFGRRSSNDSEIHEEGIQIPQHDVLEAEARGSSRRDSSSSVSGHSSLRDRRAARAARLSYTRESHKRRDSRGESDRSHHGFTPTCVLTGSPGIGKSELAVEFAYRHLQKYRRVLWVGGECRYLRQNYLNLARVLGVDVGLESNSNNNNNDDNNNNDNTSPGVVVRTFDELEESAVHKVRHALENDIPCLLIIDNVNASRDSWDGRELAELLPRAGSAAHVIITTRLPRVMHLDSVEVPFLSSFEALALMRRGKHRSSGVFSVQQIDKFKELETKLGRLPFGLTIVGRLINEFKLKPSELLKRMEAVDSKMAPTEPDAIFGTQPFLVKLLDVCFGLMCRGAAVKNCMAVRMAYVGGWFAPAPCPLSLLAAAAGKLAKELGGLQMQGPEFVTSVLSCWLPNRHNADVDASGALLTRLGLARVSPRQDCLYFPDILQTYCRMRGGEPAARAFVRGMCKSGSVVQHYDHFWAAVYLVCRGFGTAAPVVTPDFQVPDVLLLTRGLVLPLATRAVNAFSRCTAALEVLRLCYAMLEDVEKSYVADIKADQPLCWHRGKSGPGPQVDEYVWQDLTLLKAVVLEARAKLMLRGGQYDGGEELCRTCISIRTVMLGAHHPDTIAAHHTLSKLTHSKLSHARSR